MSDLRKSKVTRFTVKRGERLCEAIIKSGGNISRACEIVNVERRTFYIWWNKGRADDAQEHYKEFYNNVEEAKELGIDTLIDETRRRAFEGVDVPVHHQGELVDTYKKYSDSLAMFLIKGQRKQFVDRHEISGPEGGPIRTQSKNITAELSGKEASQLYSEMIKGK